MKNNLFLRQLGEYFETYLHDINSASENTISAYADAFAVFFQFMSDTKNLPHHRITYKNFTAAMIDEYQLWLKNERKYSNSSICQRISAISSFLNYASRREMSALKAFSIVNSTKLPRVKKTDFPYFTIEEMEILLRLPNPNVYLGKRDLVVLSFLYDTAARAQEICSMSAGDVRFGSTTKVKLNGKGGKAREIPISAETANLLRYHFKNYNLNGSDKRSFPLFTSQTNEEMTTACVRSIVDKYVAIAKKDYPNLFSENRYSPHSFRHSKAIHMIEAGISLIYIRNFLGHATISSTEVYARVGQAAVTKALTERKIPQLSSGTPNSNNSCSLPSFIVDAR